MSILTIIDGSFEVRSTGGDTHLGGEDFDRRLIDHCVAHFKKETGIDVSSKQQLIAKLRISCEAAKRTLSTARKTMISITNFEGGKDFKIALSIYEFDTLCDDLFQKCLPAVEKALAESGLMKSQIHDIVLVGGSTRIPKV